MLELGLITLVFVSRFVQFDAFGFFIIDLGWLLLAITLLV